MDLSFSGAGFMGCYYFGVVDCWNKYIPRERVNRVTGASAGSLIAAYYLMDLPLSRCLKKIIELTEDIRRRPMGVFDRSNQIVDILPRVLDELFPEDAHKRVSGRLFVCMTRAKDMKKGEKHIDGGFSDNLPIFDENTIRICCFAGATDISPYDKAKMDMLSGTVFNMPFHFSLGNFKRMRRALFPPPASFIVDLLERGFHDTKDFILSNDLIQCESCYRKCNTLQARTLLSARISPTLTPSVSPMAKRRALADSADADGEAVAVPPPVALDERQLGEFKLDLESKLREFQDELDLNNNNTTTGSSSKLNEALGAPMILISSAEVPPTAVTSDAELDSAIGANSETSSSSSTTSSNNNNNNHQQQDHRPAAAARMQLRRNTVQAGESSLLKLEDKFTLAPVPLPSCPPSPNLNRHCSECIKLRQEARLDRLEDEIRREADAASRQHGPAKAAKKGSAIKLHLGSPIKWLRQIGVRRSYKFEATPPPSLLEVS